MKVWILERYYTPEECLETAKKFEEILSEYKGGYDPYGVELIQAKIEESKKRYRSGEGRWAGFEGKTNYKAFIQVAQEAILRNKGVEFRVVEGEIDPGADTWIGYKTVKVNEGVMKYLKYLTARTK